MFTCKFTNSKQFSYSSHLQSCTFVVVEPVQHIIVDLLSLLPAVAPSPLIVNGQTKGRPATEQQIHTLLKMWPRLLWQHPMQPLVDAAPQLHFTERTCRCLRAQTVHSITPLILLFAVRLAGRQLLPWGHLGPLPLICLTPMLHADLLPQVCR